MTRSGIGSECMLLCRVAGEEAQCGAFCEFAWCEAPGACRVVLRMMRRAPHAQGPGDGGVGLTGSAAQLHEALVSCCRGKRGEAVFCRWMRGRQWSVRLVLAGDNARGL